MSSSFCCSLEEACFGFIENFFSRISAVHSAYAALYFNLGVLAHHRASLCQQRHASHLSVRQTEAATLQALSHADHLKRLRALVEEAAVHYQRAVEIQPRYAAALFNWGCLIQLLGEAELSCERLRRLSLSSPPAGTHPADRTAVDRFLGAALKYCRASQVDPNLFDAMVNLGTCFLRIVLSDTATLMDRVECFKVARALWLETQLERGPGRLDYLTELQVKKAAAILRTLQGDAELGGDPDQAAMARRLQQVELLTQPLGNTPNPRDAIIPRKEGYLTKRGAFVKSWKRRYFVLDAIKLSYYTNEDKRQRRGVIRLVGLQDCRPSKRSPAAHKRYYFDVITHTRVWNFFADSQREMNEWVQVIRQCCDA